MDRVTLTFLGTGTSMGVPYIGCSCPVCTSRDVRDDRMRASALVDVGPTRLLIDAGPDFRRQMLGQTFRRLDGVLLTHIHYDHVGGIDDLRPFCQFGEVDVYADENTSRGLMRAVPYCFAEHRYPGAPRIQLHTIEPHRPLHIGCAEVVPFTVLHDRLPILAYRVGPLAYITDMKSIADGELPYLEGVDTLVVNALRFGGDHHSHQNVEQAIALARRVGAHRTYITHLSHGIGRHADSPGRLPSDVMLAYDGLRVDVGGASGEE